MADKGRKSNKTKNCAEDKMITNFCLSHLSVHSLKAWLVIIQIHKGNHVWFTLANCSIESTASTKPMCSFRAQQHVMGSPNCIYELLIPCYEKSQWNSRGSVLLQGPWVREDPTAFTPSTCQPLSSLCAGKASVPQHTAAQAAPTISPQ